MTEEEEREEERGEGWEGFAAEGATEAGCCALQAAASSFLIVSLAGYPVYMLLR